MATQRAVAEELKMRAKKLAPKNSCRCRRTLSSVVKIGGGKNSGRNYLRVSRRPPRVVPRGASVGEWAAGAFAI